MKDDNKRSHDFKGKINQENNENVLKNNNKIENNANNDLDNVITNKKKSNKLLKLIIGFFTKISNKLDKLAGLDEKDHDKYEVVNENEDININDNNLNDKDIDEKFIKHLNIRFNKQNNLKSNKKNFNNSKREFKDKYIENNDKNSNKPEKEYKNNSKENIIDNEFKKTNFDNSKDKTDKKENSLVFLRNLKKINKFSEDKNNLFNDDRKRFFSDKGFLIENQENDKYFENNSDKTILNEKKLNLRDLFKMNKKNFAKIKNKIITDEETKTLLGAAIFGLILIVIVSSSYYFLFYNPFQEELTTAKIAKLNELNSIYKGPLSLDTEAFTLKSQIENAKSSEEIKTIDIIRPATESWRSYHNREINIVKDNFSRVMAIYTSNESKNIIMDVGSAHKMVANNDATVLANIEFIKPDTVVVPILVTRLQAGAGLISIGSVIDIYTLKSANTGNQEISSDAENDNGTEPNSNTSDSLDQNSLNSGKITNDSSISNGPDISGATVLAIMRSKDKHTMSSMPFYILKNIILKHA